MPFIFNDKNNEIVSFPVKTSKVGVFFHGSWVSLRYVFGFGIKVENDNVSAQKITDQVKEVELNVKNLFEQESLYRDPKIEIPLLKNSLEVDTKSYPSFLSLTKYYDIIFPDKLDDDQLDLYFGLGKDFNKYFNRAVDTSVTPIYFIYDKEVDFLEENYCEKDMSKIGEKMSQGFTESVNRQRSAVKNNISSYEYEIYKHELILDKIKNSGKNLKNLKNEKNMYERSTVPSSMKVMKMKWYASKIEELKDYTVNKKQRIKNINNKISELETTVGKLNNELKTGRNSLENLPIPTKQDITSFICNTYGLNGKNNSEVTRPNKTGIVNNFNSPLNFLKSEPRSKNAEKKSGEIHSVEHYLLNRRNDERKEFGPGITGYTKEEKINAAEAYRKAKSGEKGIDVMMHLKPLKNKRLGKVVAKDSKENNLSVEGYLQSLHNRSNDVEPSSHL